MRLHASAACEEEVYAEDWKGHMAATTLAGKPCGALPVLFYEPQRVESLIDVDPTVHPMLDESLLGLSTAQTFSPIRRPFTTIRTSLSNLDTKNRLDENHHDVNPKMSLDESLLDLSTARTFTPIRPSATNRAALFDIDTKIKN
ncbi:unnamed protein product, partial [Mesorhabditis spiculigera]